MNSSKTKLERGTIVTAKRIDSVCVYFITLDSNIDRAVLVKKSRADKYSSYMTEGSVFVVDDTVAPRLLSTDVYAFDDHFETIKKMFEM
jgi:hypothetical protein